ncbi:hypothetical protein ACFQL4_17270 [Halosimplex aquaticum]
MVAVRPAVDRVFPEVALVVQVTEAPVQRPVAGLAQVLRVQHGLDVAPARVRLGEVGDDEQEVSLEPGQQDERLQPVVVQRVATVRAEDV